MHWETRVDLIWQIYKENFDNYLRRKFIYAVLADVWNMNEDKWNK